METKTTPNPLRRHVCLAAAFFTFGCGGGTGVEPEPEPMPDPDPDLSVSLVNAADVANNGDATDVQISLTAAPGSAGVTEYRLIIVLDSAAGSFNLAAAQAVPAGRYLGVPAGMPSAAVRTTLTPGVLVRDGSAVEEDVPYQVFVLSVSNGTLMANDTLTGPVPLLLTNETAVGTIADVFAASGDIAMGPDGNIYVADFGQALNNANGTTVYRVTPQGARNVFVTGQAGAAGNEFDAQGNLLQSNIMSGLVRRISPSGNGTVLATGLAGPTGIAVDSAGNIYNASCTNNALNRITPGGVVTVFAATSLFNCPNGVTIGPDGTIYVGNFGDGRLLAVDGTGGVTQLASISGGGIGHVQYADGRVYVVSRGGHQIWDVALDGTSTLLAGSGQRGKTDGPALEAQFSLPNGIGVTPSGDTLYVNDLLSNIDASNLNPIVLRRIILPR